jgi:sialic acid synthase SpsE
MFILDMGSGNSCDNHFSTIKEMIDSIAEIDKDRKIILKWQLFKEAGKNVPLDHDSFRQAYEYAKYKGFKTTASVFDKESLDFLLTFDIPFVKIANNEKYYYLVNEIPRGIIAIISADFYDLKKFPISFRDFFNNLFMHCVPKYPAEMEDYIKTQKGLPHLFLTAGISDHTTNWDLYRKYKPKIYECHYVLKHNKNNLDGGLFARTPEMLEEIIDEIE